MQPWDIHPPLSHSAPCIAHAEPRDSQIDEPPQPSPLRRADQGRLLDCVVRWGNLTEGKIRAYLGEVLEAVRYLHNCRIAHLDLKVSRDTEEGVLPAACKSELRLRVGGWGWECRLLTCLN